MFNNDDKMKRKEKKSEFLGFRLSEKEKERLQEKARNEDRSMGQLLRNWIDEHCNPSRSIKEIDKEINKIKKELEEKKEKKIGDLKERRQRIMERKEEEKEKLQKYKKDIIELLLQIYKSGDNQFYKLFNEGKFERFIYQIKSNNRYEELSIRNEKRLVDVGMDCYKEYDSDDPRDMVNTVYERLANEGVFRIEE